MKKNVLEFSPSVGRAPSPRLPVNLSTPPASAETVTITVPAVNYRLKQLIDAMDSDQRALLTVMAAAIRQARS